MELEGVDESDRPTNAVRHPIAYAFEPVRAEGVLAPPTEPDLESDDERDISERTGNSRWCLCRACVPMSSDAESVCCQEMNLDHLITTHHSCITSNLTFRMLCLEREVLEVSMLLLRDVRAETLERPINSR